MSQALFLDDQQVRHDAFKAQFGSKYRIEHCYNIAQFLHFVLTFPGTIEFVSLDHDLGDYTVDSHAIEPCKYGTGMDAAKLLCILPVEFRPISVNVHSHNYTRQEAMIAFLRSNGYPGVTAVHYTDE